MKKTYYEMFYLINCVLHNETPDKEKVSRINFDELYRVCKFHSLTAIVSVALESTGLSEDNWKQDLSKSIRKTIMLDVERKKICDFLEENGIWHMPLKGVVLKEMYPQIGMREMADNDILYDSTYQDKLFQFMSENGYYAENVGKFHHDTYLKPPVLNFEMHTSLYNEIYDKRIAEYYSCIKDRLIKDSGKEFSYHFSDEDFYIYMIVHEYKHYKSGGTGLRSLLDTYIYLHEKSDSLNRKYISEELKKLGIEDFETKSRQLSMKLFSSSPIDKELSNNEKKLLECYINSGTYGTMGQYVQNAFDDFCENSGSKSKLKYIWHRIFPPMTIYKVCFPFFYKHKILLPVGWVYRLIRGIFKKRNKVKCELKYLSDL